jgi:hypothetical protein
MLYFAGTVLGDMHKMNALAFSGFANQDVA